MSRHWASRRSITSSMGRLSFWTAVLMAVANQPTAATGTYPCDSSCQRAACSRLGRFRLSASEPQGQQIVAFCSAQGHLFAERKATFSQLASAYDLALRHGRGPPLRLAKVFRTRIGHRGLARTDVLKEGSF